MDEETRKVDKFDIFDEGRFTETGERTEYIDEAQARVLAITHARDNKELYGPEYAEVTFVWEVVSLQASEDYFDINLSFRPAGRFRGEPGREQIVLDDRGNIVLRQMLDEPSDVMDMSSGQAVATENRPAAPEARTTDRWPELALGETRLSAADVPVGAKRELLFEIRNSGTAGLEGTVEELPDEPWLELQPAEFSLRPGQTVTITATLDASDATPGQTYTGTIYVNSNAGDQSVPIRMDVGTLDVSVALFRQKAAMVAGGVGAGFGIIMGVISPGLLLPLIVIILLWGAAWFAHQSHSRAKRRLNQLTTLPANLQTSPLEWLSLGLHLRKDELRDLSPFVAAAVAFVIFFVPTLGIFLTETPWGSAVTWAAALAMLVWSTPILSFRASRYFLRAYRPEAWREWYSEARVYLAKVTSGPFWSELSASVRQNQARVVGPFWTRMYISALAYPSKVYRDTIWRRVRRARRCPTCGWYNPRRLSFCEKDGVSLLSDTRQCISCQAQILIESEFCTECGARQT